MKNLAFPQLERTLERLQRYNADFEKKLELLDEEEVIKQNKLNENNTTIIDS